MSGTMCYLCLRPLSYVSFALRRPEHFTVMFDAPLSKRKHPDSAAAAEQAFATLMSFVKGGQDADRLPSGDLRQMALLAWTMVHGIAKLLDGCRFPQAPRFSSSPNS
jgi:Tetracyclin repressor-like, C-terminal domain